MSQPLTFASVDVRAVLLPLRRPVVSRVGRFEHWPLILADLHTAAGVTGRSHIEPYLAHAARCIAPAIRDLAAARAGSLVRPLEDFENARRSLSLIGYEGIAMIAISALDMAAWDALARAAGVPPAVLLAAARARCAPTTATGCG